MWIIRKVRTLKKHLLDWDTVVNDSTYAYTGSIKLQKKFFDYDVKLYSKI